ncbi:MAG TPA: phosphohydrolase [Gammaproteobacteria bacterium]|nr:phosphohydrolase [Gammaproteobacteria bacterium]
MKKLCIYHGNCADGFGAATAIRIALGGDNVDFHAGIYQDPPPDVTGRDVILVDFCYKRDVILQMAALANSILILDHHKSAAQDMVIPIDAIPDNLRMVFDMTKSGAVIAWEHFHPGEDVPPLLLHIQDRDLWEFKLDGTREIQACLFSYPYEFEIWEQLLFSDPQKLREDGKAIERKHFKDIKEFIAVAAYTDTIAGHEVPMLNAPYFWSSDAGHIMGEGKPFAACYWDTPEGRVFSLRSANDGLDVSEIAALFGGGGHKHASGFRLAFDDLDKLASGR